jgi:hypothetical protein
MSGHRGIRIALLIVQAFVALTAVVGGAALVIGSLDAEFSTIVNPPLEYLAGSPFDSHVIPGLILAVMVGGVHVAAFVLLERSRPSALFAAAAGGYAVLIWIFVQMLFIPFSVLQAVYFAAGLAELGLVLLLLGLFRTARPHTPVRARKAAGSRESLRSGQGQE